MINQVLPTCFSNELVDGLVQGDTTQMAEAGVTGIVSFYCLCSGGMLVINKLAVHMIGAPAFVTICQFAATAAVRH